MLNFRTQWENANFKPVCKQIPGRQFHYLSNMLHRNKRWEYAAFSDRYMYLLFAHDNPDLSAVFNYMYVNLKLKTANKHMFILSFYSFQLKQCGPKFG